MRAVSIFFACIVVIAAAVTAIVVTPTVQATFAKRSSATMSPLEYVQQKCPNAPVSDTECWMNALLNYQSNQVAASNH